MTPRMAERRTVCHCIAATGKTFPRRLHALQKTFRPERFSARTGMPAVASCLKGSRSGKLSCRRLERLFWGFFTMRSFIFAGALALAGSLASAEEAVPPPQTPQPRVQRTQHELHLDGQVIKYTATVGWVILKRSEFGKQEGKADKDGKDPGEQPIARFGYTAYTLDGVKDASRRPVTFAFNGGPGSSSIWLHMAVLGPKRVVVKDGGYAPPPPVQLVDNEFTHPRCHRHRADRPGRHRIQQAARRRRRQGVLGRRPGHRIGRRIHQALRHGERPLGLARSTCWARATAGSAARDSRTTSSRGSA